MKVNFTKLRGFLVGLTLLGAVALQSCSDEEVSPVPDAPGTVIAYDANVYYLSGTVTNSSDGEGISGVKVKVYSSSDLLVDFVTSSSTDPVGAYKFKLSDTIKSGYITFEPADASSYVSIPTIYFTGATGSASKSVNAVLTKAVEGVALDTIDASVATVATNNGVVTVTPTYSSATLALTDNETATTTTYASLEFSGVTTVTGLTGGISTTEISTGGDSASLSTLNTAEKSATETESVVSVGNVPAGAFVLTPTTAIFSKAVEIIVLTNDKDTTPPGLSLATRAVFIDGFTEGTQIVYKNGVWVTDSAVESDYNPYKYGDGTYTLKTKSFAYTLGVAPTCETTVKSDTYEILKEYEYDNLGTTINKTSSFTYDMYESWTLDSVTNSVTNVVSDKFKAQINSYIANFFGVAAAGTKTVSQDVTIAGDSKLYVGIIQPRFTYTFTFNDGKVVATVTKYGDVDISTVSDYGTMSPAHNGWHNYWHNYWK